MSRGCCRMDKSLLRKVAIQSLALMIAVISFSYACSQYQPITIQAVGKINDDISNHSTTAFANTIVSAGSFPGLIHKVEVNAVQRLEAGESQVDIMKQGDKYLVIKKPRGTQLAIKLDDLYNKKSIQLTISGMTVNEFSKDMISRVEGKEVFLGEPQYKEITSTQVDKESKKSVELLTKDYGKDFCRGLTIKINQNLNSNQYTAQVLIELDGVYAYKLYEDADNYYISVRKPSEVYDKILVIDAGHGGKDSGALSRNEEYYEKNINLQILQDLKKLLNTENIKVYYTRTGDDTVYLRPRVELANEVDCDYFISIHCNGNKLSSPNGTEVLYSNKKFKGVKSSDLAKLFSKEIDKTISLKNKGIVKRHQEDIYIMDKAKVPMILIEVGYVTNYNDMNYLNQDKNRKAVAKGIYNGIMKAYQELPVDK